MTRPPAGILTTLFLTILALGLPAADAGAFMKDGCGSGNCIDCHALSVEEAAKLLKPLELDKVTSVSESPVKGLWAVEAEKGGGKGMVFVDFGKKHVLQAQIVRLDTKENVTGVRRVDASKIDLANALLVGKADAPKSVIVFSDPDCHFCANLHKSIRAVVDGNPDIAFRIVLFSRNNDPAVIRKAQAILCSKSLPMLDDAYAGKAVPAPGCETNAPVENAKVAAAVGVVGTPVLVMPDGRLLPGFREPDAILRLLKEDETLAPKPPAK
jgi:thiol:disulfide interchange protein DsbC